MKTFLIVMLGTLLTGTMQSIGMQSIGFAQPRATTAPAARATRPDAAEPLRVAQDLYLESLLSKPDREQWTVLPEWIYAVSFDVAGNARFHATPSWLARNDPLMRSQVEDVFSGKTRTFRSAPLALIDSRGRYWDVPGSTLQCFDGKSWTSYAASLPPAVAGRAAASAPATRGARAPRVAIPSTRPGATFERFAFEDSAGNCWFVGSRADGKGLHVLQIKPDGSKIEHLIPDDRTSGTARFPDSQMGFFEQENGCLTLVLPMVVSSSFSNERPELRAYRYDGTKWSRIDPKFCEHKLAFIIPQKDGSLKLICDAGRVWTYWPEDSIERIRKVVAEWFSALDDLDPAKRNSALRGLLTVGPQLNSLLPASKDEELSPASQISMERIRQNYVSMATVDDRRLHSALAAYDVGVEIGAVMPIARTLEGGAVLSAAPVKLPGQDAPSPRGFVWIARDGSIVVRPAVEQGFVQPFAGGASPGRGWADRTGTIWRDDTYRLTEDESYQIATRRTPDGQYAHALPPGGTFYQCLGEDKDGRLYFKTNNRVMHYDPSRPARKDWKQLMVTADRLYSSADNRSGIALAYPLNGAPRLLTVTPAGAKSFNVPFDLKGNYTIVTLNGGACIIEPKDTAENGPSLFFDGAGQWVTAKDSITLVKENAKLVMKHASTAMPNEQRYTRVAADQREDGSPRGLWLVGSDRQREPGAMSQPPLAYFDGDTWRDVSAELRQIDPSYRGPVITTLNRGHKLLTVPARLGKSLTASYEDGKLAVSLGQERSSVRDDVQILEDGDGLWYAIGGLHQLSEGKLLPVSDQLHTIHLRDRSGHAWFSNVAKRALIVRDGDIWRETEIPTLERSDRLFEGPDGRLWLAQMEAIWLVELSGSGEQRSIHTQRFPWDGPKLALEESFIDERNGLWIYADSRRLVRYVLPTIQHPAAPSATQP